MTAIPFQVVPGAGVDSKGGKEQEISLNESGSAENTLDGMDDSDDIIVGDVSENNNDIGVPVAESQGTSDAIWGFEDLEVEDRASESSDLEDITDEFADPAFRSAIRSELGLSEDAPITKSACANISALSLYDLDDSIKNLEGIKNLTNLQYLDCSDNQLTSLDVSGCTNLSELHCGRNQLTSLDIRGCTNLIELNCEANQLTNLDASSCLHLEHLECYTNQLTSLNVNDCTDLITLRCGWNQLTSLDISGCTHLKRLSCERNQLTSLDVDSCTKLIELNCEADQLTNLDVSGCTNLRTLNCGSNQLTSLDVSGHLYLESLDCSHNNQLASLNIENCPSLESLNCSKDILTTLDLNGCLGLKELDCSYNNMRSTDDVKGKGYGDESLLFLFFPQNNSGNASDPDDVTATFTDPRFVLAVRSVLGLDKNESIISRSACANISELNISGKQIENLNGIEYFENLATLDCSDNRLESLDLSNLINLITLNCSNNPLEVLELSGKKNLTTLDCSCQGLESLDVSNCPKLENLNYEKDRISSGVYGCMRVLNVRGCSNLQSLYCNLSLMDLDASNCSNLTSIEFSRYSGFGWGSLDTLDVSGCSSLKELYCGQLNMESLKINNCSSLERLHCQCNKLTSLDLSGCINLQTLSFYQNQLISLDLSDCINLKELYASDPSMLGGSGNQNLTRLDVSKCCKLTDLYCGNGKLTNLDVSKCPYLQSLSCYNNQLTNLDISRCTGLTELRCEDNQLTNLDISSCTSLVHLSCGRNQLTSLNIDGCITLSRLYCEGNQLTSLDISNCDFFNDGDINSTLQCRYNNMTTPADIKGNTKEVDGETFKFYPQNNGVDAPTTPTSGPTQTPTASPTDIPTHTPTATPTTRPTQGPTAIPTETPAITPTDIPPVTPTATPTTNPTQGPTAIPTETPTINPTDGPTVTPTATPKPTISPTQRPTISPTDRPTLTPTPSQKAKKAQRLTVKPSPVTLYIGGASASKTLRVAGAKGKVTYKSSNVRVVKVNTRGKLTPISTGKATVTIKAAGNGSYRAATVKVKITVSDKKIKDAYKNYVKRYLSSKKEFPAGRYELYDINGDSIPEMFFSYLSGSRRTYKIYTCKKGKVIKVGELSGCTDISYNKKKRQICVQSSDGAAQDILTCYELGTKKLRQVCRYRHISEDINGKTRQRYYKDDKKISKRAYKKFADTISRWPVLGHRIQSGT